MSQNQIERIRQHCQCIVRCALKGECFKREAFFAQGIAREIREAQEMRENEYFADMEMRNEWNEINN